MAGLLGCDRHGRTLRGLGGLGNLIGGGKTETGGLQQNERLGSNSSQWGLSAPRQKHTENEKDREGVREVLLSPHRCPGWRYPVSTRPGEHTCRSPRRLEEWKDRDFSWVMSICEGIYIRSHAESTLCLSVCGRNSKLNSVLSGLPMRAFQSWGSYFEKFYCSFIALEKFLLKILRRNKNIQ